MFYPRKAPTEKLLASWGMFTRHLVTVENTTTNPIKKKYNDSALKKWAIVSPLVQPSQLVIATNISDIFCIYLLNFFFLT